MKELHINQINMHYTLRCNLKCKLCISYSPYYKSPFHPSFERVKEITDRFFDIFTTCGSFLILGGEPLIRDDIPEILEHLLKYINQITKMVRINTNGSIAIKDDIIGVAHKYENKITFIIDDYGSGLSKHAVNNVEKLQRAGINCELRDYVINPYFGGWVDFGDMATRKNTLEEAVKLFNKCACAPWREDRSMGCFDGDIYICCQAKYCMHQEIIPKNQTEYVDMLDDLLSIEQIRNKILDLQNLKYQSACQFCTGICPDSIRFPAAEQIANLDEIQKI